MAARSSSRRTRSSSDDVIAPTSFRSGAPQPIVALHQPLADVRAWVPLVAVDQDRLVRIGGARGELPLGAGREAGAAAPAHVGLLDLLEQLRRRQRVERVAEAVVRPALEQDGLVQHARALRLAGLAQLAGERAAQDV